jgi:F-type H+-transporting ATPase subunit b
MSKSSMTRMMSTLLVIALGAVPALAQPAAPAAGEAPPSQAEREAERATKAAPGDSAEPSGPGTEHHTGQPGKGHDEHHDPSLHFNYFGFSPGKLFDYMGKDEYGGPMGDGKMVDHKTGQVVAEELPASPPFIFMLLNFALLLGLLAWKGRPVAQQVAAERHDLIKTALDEAAKLRAQAASKLTEYETRLKAADSEIKAMIEGIRADARSEEKRILAAAEAQAAMMKRDAELRIAAEIELARVQLTREVTQAAVAATEKILRDKMTAGDQQQLVAAFITDVQQASAAGRAGKGEVR